MSSKKIPFLRREFSIAERQYVTDCLDSGWVSSAGGYVDKLEAKAKAYFDVPFALATNSGTSALHLALQACGTESGELVIVPSLTFVATANVVRYLGAEPLFIDVEPRFLQIDTERVAHFMARECHKENAGLFHKATKKKIRALIAVHLRGHPAEVAKLSALCQEHQVTFIEDAAQSLGSYYEGKLTGTWSDAATFSFNGNKLITGGAGGLFLTKNPDWAAKARYLATQAREKGTATAHDDVGFNYRMASLPSALVLGQWERLEAILREKRRIYDEYRACLKDSDVAVYEESPVVKSNHWLVTLRLPPRLDRKDVAQKLALKGIETLPLWYPLPLCRPYQASVSDSHEGALCAFEKSLSIPSYVGMTDDEKAKVIEAVLEL